MQELDSNYWNTRRNSGDTVAYIADLNTSIVLHRALRDRPIKSVIEIGCGAGRNFPLYADLGIAATCIDFSSVRMAIAEEVIQFCGFKTITACIGDAVRDPLPNRGRADAIIITYVLQHLNETDVAVVLSKIKQSPARWLFLLEYYTEPLDALLAIHNRRRVVAGGKSESLDSKFTSRLYDYPKLVGLPYVYIPIIQRRPCSLLIFDKGA